MSVKLKNVRVSFPNLFRPKAFNADQEAKYSATFILDKNDPQVKAIEEAMKAAAVDKWGDKAQAVYKNLKANDKLAVRDGATKEDLDGFGEGVVFFNASNSKRPTVVDRDRSPLVEEDGRPYAGCYVNVIIDFWGQDNQYGKRINASLGGVQFAADGEAFGGGGAPVNPDDFDDVSEGTGEDFGAGGDTEDEGW